MKRVPNSVPFVLLFGTTLRVSGSIILAIPYTMTCSALKVELGGDGLADALHFSFGNGAC